jgi:hypothetical protein
VLFGDDCAFTNSTYNFEFIELFMKRFNNYSQRFYGDEIILQMSTMDEYLKELKKMDYEYPVYRGDFLPEIE